MALTASDIDTSKTSGHRERLDRIGMALEALRNVITASPGSQTSTYLISTLLGGKAYSIPQEEVDTFDKPVSIEYLFIQRHSSYGKYSTYMVEALISKLNKAGLSIL